MARKGMSRLVQGQIHRADGTAGAEVEMSSHCLDGMCRHGAGSPRQSRQQAGASWEHHRCRGKLLERGAGSCSQAPLSVLAPRLRVAPHRPHDNSLHSSSWEQCHSRLQPLSLSGFQYWGVGGETYTAWGQGRKARLTDQTDSEER